MATSTVNFNATVTATSFTGSGSGISLTAPTQVVTTNGSSQLISTSGYSTSGTANTFALRDGSGNLTANAFSGNGASLTSLTGANVNMSNPNQVVITNGSSALTSEAQLATTRGGFGVNPTSGLSTTTSPGNAIVVSGGSLFTVPYGTSNTANTLVQRDASGNIDISTVVQTNGNGTFTLSSGYIQTTNATATTLFTLATSSTTTVGSRGTVYQVRAEISVGQVTGTGGDVNSAVYSFYVKASNVDDGTGSKTRTVSSILSLESTTDSGIGLPATPLSTSFSTDNLLLQVTGVAATTYNWFGNFRITSVTY
jgi:trimeric autotransporter adhesin